MEHSSIAPDTILDIPNISNIKDENLFRGLGRLAEADHGMSQGESMFVTGGDDWDNVIVDWLGTTYLQPAVCTFFIRG